MATQSKPLTLNMLIISLVAYLYALYILFAVLWRETINEGGYHGLPPAVHSSLVRRRKLTWFLFLLFFLFPLIYYLEACGLLNRDNGFIFMKIYNVITNCIYIYIKQSYFEDLLTVKIYYEEIESSRSFSRYVIEHARIPLQSLSVAIDSLGKYNFGEEGQIALKNIVDSTQYMESILRIPEGTENEYLMSTEGTSAPITESTSSGSFEVIFDRILILCKY